MQGRIALETAAGGRRAIVKPNVAGYVTLATPCGNQVRYHSSSIALALQ